ncbi:MAG TPA: hypothetical protein VNW99_12930 [Cytophagaceae bacterium]|nr:hypothetical protein [Cytophagaceae bacterium]
MCFLKSKSFLFFNALLICTPAFAQIDKYKYDHGPTLYSIYKYDHNPLTLRGAIGIGQISISGLDTIPNRIAIGIYGHSEVRLLSKKTDKKTKGFTIYDALSLDLFMGTMLGVQLVDFLPERKHALSLHFGYMILSGYRNDKFGIMGGLNFQTIIFNVGTTNTKHLFTAIPPPLVIRAEFRPAFGYEFRIMATVWDNFTNERNSRGIRLDIPLAKTKRLFLTFEASTIVNATIQPTNFDADKYTKGNLNQMIIGVRYGSVY